VRKIDLSRVQLFFTLIFLIFLLSGCFGPDIVFFSDKFFWEIYLTTERESKNLLSFLDFNQSKIKKEIKRIAREHDKRIVFEKVERIDDFELLRKKIRGIEAELYVFTPLMGEIANDLADEFPQKTFIVLGGKPEKKNDNTHFLYFDRREAFNRAGIFSGNLLNEMIKAKRSEKFYVGVLFYTSTEEREEELEAFKKGFLQVSQEAELIIRKIESLDDFSDANNFLREFQTRNVSLILLAASSLNPQCMEILAKDESMIITENIAHSQKYSDRVLLSVEEDLNTAFKEIIKISEIKEEKVMTVPAKLIPGKDLSGKNLELFKNFEEQNVKKYK